jgi:hypothetical protein
LDKKLGASVRVNVERCRAVAMALDRAPIPVSREEFELVGFPEDLSSNYLLCVVAICHQTQELRGNVDGVLQRGWDFLSAKLKQAAELGSFKLQTESWRSVDAHHLREIFSCETHGFTLSDPEGRAELIRDLGDTMSDRGWTSLRDPFTLSNHCAMEGPDAFLASLRRFRAYRDPVHKKSLYLVALLTNSLHWNFRDAGQLPAPVDYHEVRGHLRVGTVEIVNRQLLGKVHRNTPVTGGEDVEIRLAVQKAISVIAATHGGVTPTTIHYLFWNVFRNVCLRQTPLCTNAISVVHLPSRYEYLLELRGNTRSCPFSKICRARSSEAYPLEHNSPLTTWY